MNNQSGTEAALSGGETICTLFDGDFHYGLAALVNSLVHAGYKGTVWAGYRGALPPWVDQLKALEADKAYSVTNDVTLVFVPVDTDRNLATCKPSFMLELLSGPARGCDYIWFFDADIFVRCDWKFFQHWERCGIAVCQDILHHLMPDGDPLRQQWCEAAASMGLSNPRSLQQYFNSGLVGVAAEYASFLTLWNRFIDRAGDIGMDLRALTSGSRELDPFHIHDQDAMNAAAMFTEYPLSPVGPEIMGFLPGRPVTYHAVGPKPWRGSILGRALRGEPPSNAAKFYFTKVSRPIQVYPDSVLRRKMLETKAASLIGRFYRRA